MKPKLLTWTTAWVLSIGMLGFASAPAQARGPGYAPDDDDRVEYRRFPDGHGYYPEYNPVVRRDYHGDGGYAPDGTYHSTYVEEDRHASYYAPGRNRAITRPRTTVETWDEGPGRQTTRRRTSWIGADGRPHSTTIDSTTTMDGYGNSHTDTHVTLKRAQSSGR
ncbi:MAG: hypothetical protein P9E24_08165 [Candidatus Competibacter sp.]|nr:hypothetical protein [Candidatus Competibacter sp.]MDG4583161.1 hypothetical protein [Candidatus Competibacter sp.]